MDVKTNLRHFLDAEGKLIAFPARQKMKRYALLYLSEKIEAGRSYTEREINDILLKWHTFADPATLRRELYDIHLLDRSRDGREYHLSDTPPSPQELGL